MSAPTQGGAATVAWAAPTIDELRPYGGDIDAAARAYVKALDAGADLAQWRSLMRLWAVFAQFAKARAALTALNSEP